MSYSNNDLVASLLKTRSDMLSAKRGLIIQDAQMAEQIAYFQNILYGYGGNLGILNTMEPVFQAIRFASGSESTSPAAMHSIASCKSAWESKFSVALSASGDGAGGLYPPDPSFPSVASKDFNKTCSWLTTNDMSADLQFSGCFFYYLNLIPPIIGTAGLSTDNRGPYATMIAAMAARDAGLGTALMGKRTDNTEIVGIEPTIYVGSGGIDTPDYYSGSEKPSLESALSNAIAALTSYIDAVTAFRTILQGTHPILVEAKVTLPAASATACTTIINEASGLRTTLQNLLTYFSPINNTTSATRAAFNTTLGTLNGYCTSMQTTIQNEITTLKSLIGNSATEAIRQPFAFWVSTLLAKPSGPLIVKKGIAISMADTTKGIATSDDALISQNPGSTVWLEKPEIQSVFPDPLLDENGEVITARLAIIWSAPMCCNKYKVLRRAYTIGNPIPNDQWTSNFDEFWITDIVPASGFVSMEFRQSPPTGMYIYRVVAYDTTEGAASSLDRLDTFNTSSLQSDILSESWVVSSITGEKLNFASKVTDTFAVGDGVLTNLGVFHITKIAEKIIVLDTETPTGITTLQKIKSMGTI